MTDVVFQNGDTATFQNGDVATFGHATRVHTQTNDRVWTLSAPLSAGQKPVGKVEIDWENPITRDLQICIFPTTGQMRNEVNDETVTFSHPSLGFGVSRKGQVFESTASGSMGAMTHSLGSNFTYLHGSITPTSWGVTHYAAGFGTYDPGIAYKHGNGGGNWYIFDSPAGTGDVALSTDTYYVLGLTGDGTTHRMYLNGEADNSYASTITPAAGFRIGSPGGGLAYEGYHLFAYVWGRTLSAGEIALLSEDPYQFLKPPVPETQIITPAATPNNRMWLL